MNRLLLLIFIVIGIHQIGVSQIDSTYQDIEEVIVSSNKEKKIVFEDSKYYIVDFTISETRRLLLMRKFRNYYIYELDEEMQLRHRLKLKVNASSFYEDCFGNTHLVTKDSVYFIANDSLGIFLSDSYERDLFMDAMVNCTGSTSEKIIFEKLTDYNQNQKFYTVDIDNGDKNVIYQINDSTIRRSLQDTEVLIQTEEYYSNHLRMGDIDANKEMSFLMRRLNENNDHRDFFYSHVTRPKYNPMFALDDTVYIFNHSEGKIDQMDDEGTVFNTNQISYHQKGDWGKIVYSDKATKKFYAVRIERGVQSLIALSLTDDKHKHRAKITESANPKKLIILDGYVYYTYKPNVDANLNKLYRQKL